MSVDEDLIADLEAQLAAVEARRKHYYTEQQRRISYQEWERHDAKMRAGRQKPGGLKLDYDGEEWREAVADSYEYRHLTLSRSLKLARMGLPVEAGTVVEITLKPLASGIQLDALGLLIILTFYDALTKSTFYAESCDFYDALLTVGGESDLLRCFIAPKRAIREWKEVRETSTLPSPPTYTFAPAGAKQEWREQFKAGRRWQRAQAAERATQTPQLPAPHQANALPATVPASGLPTVEGFLDTIDPDNLTPKQAQDVLYELKRLRGEQQQQRQ